MTSPAKPLHARSILLVDDDTSYTAFFKDFLLSYPSGAWIVHTADHYAPALACIKQHHIDLVVLDINMPIMDGRQLLTLLKRTHPELQIVILSGQIGPELQAECIKSGATLVFDKTELAGNLEKIYAALESLADAPTEGFRGMLRQVTLADVLQMECLNRKSSVLEVTTSDASGLIVIEEGTIIHAETGPKQGEKALFAILALRGGEFKLRPFAKPARQTIDGHWESLVMEAARLNDEALAPPAPPAAAEGAQIPEEHKSQPTMATAWQVEEMVLCSGANELLYDWQSPNVNRRVQILDAVAKIAAAFAKPLGLTRGERLEIQTTEGQIILLVQPDRRVLIRSGNLPAPA